MVRHHPLLLDLYTSISFNEEYGVLTDELGLVVPLDEAIKWKERTERHLKRSELELEAIDMRFRVERGYENR